MNHGLRHTLAAGLLLGVAGVILAAPVPLQTETLKDRKDFIPLRKYESLPGKVIGVMVSDVAAVMGHDGRSGPQDAIAFSRNLGSYRWVYTVDEKTPIITGLQVKTGEQGNAVKVYPKLNMANAKQLQAFKIDTPYTLVEMEVNDGLGAPADEGFVGTNMRRLDGTKAYPLNVTKVVADLKKKYEEHKKTNAAAFDTALTAAQKKWLKEQKPTGPREVKDLMYLSWDAKAETLRVHFHTKFSDGAYNEVDGGANIDRPFPLPPLQVKPGLKPGLAAFPPPPPRFERIRVGTTFGIEYGVAYEVDKEGDLVRVLVLPAEGFGAELQPPPGIGRPRPDRLGGPVPIDP
jgi:hypothetical protein